MGIQLEIRKTIESLGLGIQFNLGRLSPNLSCPGIDESDEGDNAFCREYSDFTTRGTFGNLGVFTIYDIVSGRTVNVQFGGQLQYQYHTLEQFLGEEDLDSQSLAVCGKFMLDFDIDHWLLGGNLDLCFIPLWSGSLYEIDNETGGDIQPENSMNLAFFMGYSF